MKTPDEIKAGLEAIAETDSDKRYQKVAAISASYRCFEDVAEDALHYIRDLEAAHRTEYCENADYDCVELGKARKRIAELEAQVETLKAQMEPTEIDILMAVQPTDKHWGKAQYCLKNRICLIDFDEWCYICDVLNRDIPFEDVSLMNEYILDYNDANGTDYDWGWMDYPQDDDTRTLFEAMIAFGRARGVSEPPKEGWNYDTDEEV